jgi:hypothetical protein
MATPIREACLTADDQPNENSGRVQAALDKKGCMCVNRPGGRCKAPVVFDATEPYITCTANPRHGRAAYDKPYGKIVFGVLFGAIQEEEARQHGRRLEEQQFQQDTREANREATVLGLAEYGVYTRPGGPAPDGKTWSFALGNWQDEDYLLLHTPK